MEIMKTNYFQRITAKQIIYPRLLNSMKKIIIAFGIYLVFGLLFQHVYANTENNEVIDPYQSQHGSVWLLADNGVYIEALQMQTDVNYDITGSIARARVKQKFKNTSELWVEGIYVFPLPEKAAVDQFKLIIGDRIIEGQIKQRITAKKIYNKAKAAGKKTSLIEQQRPNVFTTSLANIAPGEEITVEFEYQQVLEYRDNSYRLRYPMVVGPRYHPADTSADNPLNHVSDNTSVQTKTDAVKNTHNPTRIHIMLDAGVTLSELKSSYHKIQFNQTSETRYSVSTIGENIIANRDFELVWKPELQNKPQLSVFNETINNTSYTMVTLLPPDLSYLQQKVQARDVIFVLDISGSMSGTSIEQAKASLITALDGLTSIDRFNIIWFNNETDSLFPKVVGASTQYKEHAKRMVEQLHADGGTEMVPALKLALSNQEMFSRFRQVIFLTDGNISNESELFTIIDKQLGNSRLFTIGIGSAPNSYFMRKAADKGRGTFTHIGDINEVQEKTITLLKKLETPALINIEVTVAQNEDDSNAAIQNNTELFPEIIPDLYAGEPLTLLLKSDELPKTITLKGDYGNTEWQTSETLVNTSQSGIRIAWAREKIASLMNQRHESLTKVNVNDLTPKDIEKKITSTALQHHLVSRFTSLVAVDVTPIDENNLNESGMHYRENMKNNLPHGWKSSSRSPDKMLTPDTVIALQLPQTATSARFNLLLALTLFIAGTLLYQLKTR